MEWVLIQREHVRNLVLSTAYSLPDVLYFSSDRRYVTAHTARGDYTGYYRLSDLVKQLPHYFYQCYKSYLINLNHVQCIENKSVTIYGESHGKSIGAVIDGLPAREAFLLGQVIRYADRAGEKDDPAVDLGKANNYAWRLVTGDWRRDA